MKNHAERWLLVALLGLAALLAVAQMNPGMQGQGMGPGMSQQGSAMHSQMQAMHAQHAAEMQQFTQKMQTLTQQMRANLPTLTNESRAERHQFDLITQAFEEMGRHQQVMQKEMQQMRQHMQQQRQQPVPPAPGPQ